MSRFLVIILAMCICYVQSQFPTSCVTQEGLESRKCCPIPEGFTELCGGSGRGTCDDLPPSIEGDYQPHFYWLQDDDRARWPSVFFDMACVCEFPFSGVDCSECVLGYYGSECTEEKTLIRKDASKNEDAVIKYLTYVNWLRTNVSSYSVMTTEFENMFDDDGVLTPIFVEVTHFDYFTWIHHYSCKNYDYEGLSFRYIGFSHLSSNFIIWHRSFLAKFERTIQQISGDDDFALPYWVWTGIDYCDVCTEELFGGQDGYLVNSLYLKDFEVICTSSDLRDTCDPTKKRGPLERDRESHINAAFPTKQEVGFLLNMEEYDTPPYNSYSNCSFRNIMGGNGGTEDGISQYEADTRYMHARAHFKIGGIMNSIPSSPNDPIFHVLHAYMDKVFEMWYRIHKPTIDVYPEEGAAIGHNRYAYQVPLFPVVKNNDTFVSSLTLGYDFDDMDENGHTSDWDEIYTDRVGAC